MIELRLKIETAGQIVPWTVGVDEGDRCDAQRLPRVVAHVAMRVVGHRLGLCAERMLQRLKSCARLLDRASGFFAH